MEQTINILITGIPTLSLAALIRARHPGEIQVYAAECRPFEVQVAKGVSALLAAGISVTMATDNMIAALMETAGICAVWGQYLRIESEQAVTVNGTLTAALLAGIYNIPTVLYPAPDPGRGDVSMFAGIDITIPGAKTMDWEFDKVPLTLITEVVINE